MKDLNPDQSPSVAAASKPPALASEFSLQAPAEATERLDPTRRDHSAWPAAILLLLLLLIGGFFVKKWAASPAPVISSVAQENKQTVMPVAVPVATQRPPVPAKYGAAVRPTLVPAVAAVATQAPPVPAKPLKAILPADAPVRPVAPGLVADEAHDFKATTLDGKPVSLKALRGHPVVLSFFMINCSLCWDEVPALERISRAHQGDGTVFLAIVKESADEARGAFKTHPLPYPAIADPNYRIASTFPVPGWPTNVVLDAQGRYFKETVVHRPMEPHLEEALRFVATKHDIATVRPPVGTDGECQLSGQVKLRHSGQPVAKAHLVFWGQKPVRGTGAELELRAESSDDGSFELRDIACGTYSMSVYSEGITELNAEVISTKAPLAPIEVTGRGRIEGIVVDPTGAPVVGAKVSLCDFNDGRTTTQTDATGAFSLSGVQARTVVVRVSGPGQQLGAAQKVVVTDEEASATHWVLGEVTLKGQVKNPEAGSMIRLSPLAVGCNAPDVPLRADGTFELAVAGGVDVLVQLVHHGAVVGQSALVTPQTGEITVTLEQSAPRSLISNDDRRKSGAQSSNTP